MILLSVLIGVDQYNLANPAPAGQVLFRHSSQKLFQSHE
jgi:hypothetical protein